MRITAPRGDIEAIAAIVDRDSRLPSPGSKLINGAWRNVCPSCGAPCSAYPWTCKACGWSAAARPDLCPCQRVEDIVIVDKACQYPVSDATAKAITAAKAKSPMSRTADEAALAKATVVAGPIPPKEPVDVIDTGAPDERALARVAVTAAAEPPKGPP